jgi:5'(3')-deoxyribonucleotidase
MCALKIMLDMDGVLVDFMGGLHKNLGVDYDPTGYPYPASKYDIFEDIIARSDGRYKVSDIYDSCNAVKFWADLEWDPMGKEILQAAKDIVGVNNIVVCTAPMTRPDAWAGKIAWLNKHTPELKKVIVMSAPKELLAKKDHMLIDDKDRNCEAFCGAGGLAYLVPQPWNARRDIYNKNYIPDLKAYLSCWWKRSLPSIWE